MMLQSYKLLLFGKLGSIVDLNMIFFAKHCVIVITGNHKQVILLSVQISNIVPFLWRKKNI